MTKLYYDDPLIAAYMTREFGVYVNCTSPDGYFIQERCKNVPWERYVTKGPLITSFIIHPDSLDIFEPKAGDIVKNDQFIGYISVENKWCANGCLINLNLSAIKEIIQRDGKQFFMPKEEA